MICFSFPGGFPKKILTIVFVDLTTLEAYNQQNLFCGRALRIVQSIQCFQNSFSRRSCCKVLWNDFEGTLRLAS